MNNDFEAEINNSCMAYLAGDSEMGELIRNYEWSATSIGVPAQWPPSLLTTIGILLNSKFPMFLFWGPEHICFYNDAYRPSLGNDGKHPAIGKKGYEIWPETWADIKPLIDKVLTGNGATWSEDQLLPIYRNGALEDVYWTFSYSAVIGETCKPIGVFVTCVETTEKVKTVKRIEESERNLRNTILQAPVAMCILKDPDYIVSIANERMLEVWGKQGHEILNKPLFEGLPEAKNQGFEELLLNVYTSGETFRAYALPTILPREGKSETVYLDFVYEAYKDADGIVSGIMAVAVEVTEQVLSRKKLEESEQQIRALVESAPFPIAVYRGREMQVELANQSILDTWGKGNNVIGKLFSEVLPELDNQEIFEQLDDVFTTGVAYHAKNERVDLVVNGKLQPFYFNYSFTPLLDALGNVYGVMNTGADVTDLNIARQKVEESENNLRNVFQQAPVAMCILRGPEFIVEIANERMLELWGKPDVEMMQKPFFTGLPEAKFQGFEELLQSVYTTGNSYKAQGVPANLPRGGKVEIVYINFLYEAYRESDGIISGVMAVATDVTEQVIARKKIELAEEKARLAINSAELGVYEIDLLTDNIISDDRFNEIFDFDYTASRQDFIDVLHPGDLGIRDAAYKTALKTGYLDYEARIIIKEKLVRWVKIKGQFIFNDNREPVKLLGVAQDITEQKQFAEALEKKVQERTKELAEANLQLQQTNVELNQFAYIASHDLQEPLRKVRTFSQLLQLSLGEVPEKAKNYIGKIEDSIERMQTLISDVLKFSLLSKEREKFEKVDLNNIFKNVLGDYELLIEQKGAKITAELLPVIDAIPIQMSQLFTNLISNALKFTSKERPPQILLKTRKLLNEEALQHAELDADKAHYLIEFKDNGIGFSQENAQQIFTIFQRLHGKIDYAGTGIGLAMCKKITLNHHGTIYAQSRLNEGASFIIILPEVQHDTDKRSQELQ